MRKALILILSLLLIAAITGCGKKPAVEQGAGDRGTGTTGGTTTETKGGDTGEQPIDTEDALKLVTIYFDFDKYNLRSDAVSDLKNNYEVLKQNQDVRVQIEGHCDERGTVEYNLALGEKRARSARDYLVNLGIPANRISIISYGKEKPVAFGSNEDAWAKNRRAEFVELR